MHQNSEDTRRGLKRKPPQMDRGQELGSYNMNSRPYDRNTLPPGGFYFVLLYFSIQSQTRLLNFENYF